jgi:hypothetical protein
MALTPAIPRQRDTAGQFSTSGSLTGKLIRKAYARTTGLVKPNTIAQAPLTFAQRRRHKRTVMLWRKAVVIEFLSR